MKLALIVAVAEHKVIGSQGGIPWHLSEDLRYFKSITMGAPVIMGRKTFESIGRPLPGRKNIVVTHQKNYLAEGVEVVHSLDEALCIVGKDCNKVFIIGGQQLYQEGLSKADLLYMTEVGLNISGDTFFPDWNKKDWSEISRSEEKVENEIPFQFVVYERVRARATASKFYTRKIFTIFRVKL